MWCLGGCTDDAVRLSGISEPSVTRQGVRLGGAGLESTVGVGSAPPERLPRVSISQRRYHNGLDTVVVAR